MTRSAKPAGSGAPARGTATALLAWFRGHRRDLPWRRRPTPYRIWVAEVLLQQTRVAHAARLYDRFVDRFPTVRALARASESEVLKAWEGAGYYARARRLRRAAREIVRRHAGRLPRSVEGLATLPGVGAYTARAVASLAFDRPVIALEANGIRVAARWLREERSPSSATVRQDLEEALLSVLPRAAPGAFNEAVMELGETVCLPAAPRCGVCPVAFGCRAFRELPDPSALPRRSPRQPRPLVRASVAVVQDRGRWLVQRRSPAGLLGGLWEFPGGRIEAGETPARAAVRELREETGLRAARWESLGIVRHDYSHFGVELHVFRGTGPAGTARSGAGRRWVTPSELARLPLPRATEKIVHRLVGDARPEPCPPENRSGRDSGSVGSRRPGRRRERRRSRRPAPGS